MYDFLSESCAWGRHREGERFTQQTAAEGSTAQRKDSEFGGESGIIQGENRQRTVSNFGERQASDQDTRTRTRLILVSDDACISRSR